MADFLELKRQAVEKHLKQATQAEVRFDHTSRRLYSTDASIYQIEPLGVVLPRTAEDLRSIVQIAGEHQLPIVPRGGGTSLSGQAIGPGIIVDCSKYLNRILDIDLAGLTARVEPGVILDSLNQALEPHGLQFGPDVATANRANLGGMIGNNSAGSRSIVYGKTIDHVRALSVVLSDGNWATLQPLSPEEWQRHVAKGGLEGTIHARVRDLILQHETEIRLRFPKILRRVSGYNLDAMLDQLEAGRINLASLIVGSEGTLAFVGEAEIGLTLRPKHRGLLVPHFESLAAALDSLAISLEMRPSAVELLDQMVLDLARENLGFKRQMSAIEGRPAAILMIEFTGDDPQEIEDRLDKLNARLRASRGLTAMVRAGEPAVRDALWNLRSAGVPLLLGVPGDRKPVTFVEDTAVTPEKLPEFVARFREILKRHGTDGSYYGHASVGCLHIRPVLNLKEAGDVARMRQITAEVVDLVLEYGGALSGEHGDGLARSEWNQKLFGDTLYQAFRDLKRAFDPSNLFNPGKVVEAPAMTDNLRFGPHYRPFEPPTVFDYSRQEGFVRSIELCNGSGVCRKLKGGAMCPSFRATRDEKDSTRGRANALRLALAGDQPLDDLRSDWVHEVLDLCLMCKACKSECPSNVDLAKLKAEFLHQYHQAKPRPRGQRLLAHVYRLNRFGSSLAPLVNWFNRRGVTRWVMERLTGVDRRRSLPRFHWRHFRRWFKQHQRDPRAGEAGRVVLLDDCFTTFTEPEVGRSAVRVLERAGFAVELANLVCCGRPLISKGFLDEAKDLVARQAPVLAQRLPRGMPVLGLEPSCLLTLSDEWPELAPGEATRRIAEAAELADGWLARQQRSGHCELPLSARTMTCVLHGHCHQQALIGVAGSADALRLIPGLEVHTLDAGCCGMAGSFGYEKEHYDLSVAIANLALVPALAERPDALVVAPGTSCRHQIKDLARRVARHPMEVLAEQVV